MNWAHFVFPAVTIFLMLCSIRAAVHKSSYFWVLSIITSSIGGFTALLR